MNRVKYELFVDSICGDVVKWMCVKKLYYNGKFAYNNCCSIILESFCSRDYKTEVLKNTGKFLIIQHPSIRSVRVLEDNLFKYTPWTSLSKFYNFSIQILTLVSFYQHRIAHLQNLQCNFVTNQLFNLAVLISSIS